MSRLSRILAAIAAVILIASSGAHSLLGWPSLRAQLVTASVPADLVQGLAMGWHFAGMAMLVLGLLLLWMLRAWRRATSTLRLPLALIGAAYVAFGVVCAAAFGWNGFLLTFLVPGTVLLVAAMLADGRADQR
jgi:hypothetical protein